MLSLFYSTSEPAHRTFDIFLIFRHDSSTSFVHDSCQRGQYEDVCIRSCLWHKNVERGEVPATSVSPPFKRDGCFLSPTTIFSDVAGSYAIEFFAAAARNSL